MYHVKKRDGRIVDFDIQKIATAIRKAFEATKTPEGSGVIDFLALRVTADFTKKIKDNIITIEDIQDSVEAVLSQAGYEEVAKAYILYRKAHERIRQTSDTLLDYKSVVDKYLKVEDWRVKENSTVTYSIGGLILSNSGAITANYWLSEVYDKEIAEAHRNCDFHIHDLSMLSGYCAGWNLKQLIQEGLGGVPGKITSAPASHLSTLCNQMVNFLGIMQNEWAGAQAFSSFDTYLAPFVKKDNLSYKEVKQAIQSFVFGVNTPSRWGTQAPFSNITLDWTVPADLKDLPAIVGGKEMDFTYGDCKKEMDMVNKAFIEIMIEGDANGRGFQYPIPTYSITRDFDWSPTENNKLLFEMTAKYGTPYFSNYINSDMEPSDVRSMCPLRGDQRVLVKDDYSGEWHISTVENLFKGHNADKVYTVFFNGFEHEARLNRFDGLNFKKIRTVNGHSVIFSDNHTNKVLRLNKDGSRVVLNIPTSEMKVGDYLPFNTSVLEGEGLDEIDGIMVGAFMGDGTVKDDYAVTYSLNMDTKYELLQNIIEIGKQYYGAKISMVNANDSGTCINLTLTSRMLRGLIDDYVKGKGTEKVLDIKALNRSVDFRRGIIAGLLQTDGTPVKNRIYTASKAGVESICTILASLGEPTRVTVDTRTVEDGSLSNNNVYCIRPYIPDSGINFREGIYIKDQDCMWFCVEEIENINEGSSIGYCFEVLDDDDPYFVLPSGLITHNCRLRLDLRELRRKSGGFFGSGESTGSIGVVTINMPRLAYLSENEADFYKRLDKLMDLAARSLKIKRDVITKLLEAGLYPYTKHYLGNFNNHFSTIGLVGMNEAGLNANWIRKDMTHKECQDFAKQVLDHMRERLSDYQEQYGDLYNLEATPAESTAYRFAKHDKEDFPGIITAAEAGGTPYYTNSSHLPVSFTDDVFEALDIQDDLQTRYTSGTVFHAFLGEKLPTWESAATLVRKIAENYKLPYYTMSPTYSVCKQHGYLTGEQFTCPYCGQSAEVYSRITGYYRPVQNWNDGKAQEYKQRREYTPAGNSPILGKYNPKEAAKEEPTSDCSQDACPIQAKAEEPTDMTPVLFASATCPNCRMAKAFMDKAGFKYREVLAAENLDLVDKFGIRQAPTLIVPKANGEYEKYAGAGAIKGFLNQNT